MTLNYQKIWNVMNDLEMVTSKISSAREILDSAIDKLEEHQYDKAGTLLYAADEFLQYYLQEFDTKFKDAWKETVTKLKQQEIDTLKISENDDGSFTMDWDPQDPKWSFLNGLTSAEIQVMIQQAIKEHLND